eukprot:Awhi_evm2s11834
MNGIELYSKSKSDDIFALKGEVGIQGPTGPIGIQGHTGPQGVQGHTGPQGDIGPTGPQGVQGHTGPQGVQGHTGPQGDIGPTGPQGDIGPTGPVGIQGDIGPTGPQGVQGNIGIQGDIGPTGPQGDIGPTGPVGIQGLTGAAGPDNIILGENIPTFPVTSNIYSLSYNGAIGDIFWENGEHLHGAGYFETQVDTNIPDKDNFYKVNAVFIPTKEEVITFDIINNRWVYTGVGNDPSIILNFTGSHSDSGTRNVTWQVRVNGVPTVYPDKEIRLDNGLSTSVTIIIPVVNIVNGDYIELYCNVDRDNKLVKTSNCVISIR